MKPAIFVSSVSRELKTARQLVANTLLALGYEPVWQDIFETSNDDLRELLRKKIDDCAAVMQIVGDAYGAEPPIVDPAFGRISYTQFEALYAQSSQKPVYYLITQSDFPQDASPEQIDGPRGDTDADREDAAVRRQLQRNYKSQVQQAGTVYHPVQNGLETELAVRKMKDELSALRREYREWQTSVVEKLDALPEMVAVTVRARERKVETETGGTFETTFPQDVRQAINRGVDKLNEGYFVQAKTEFEQALGLAEQSEQVLAIIEAKEHLARVLIHIDGELGTAKTILQSCLELLADDDNDEARAGVLQGLAEVHERQGEFELSESLQRRSLELRERIGEKFGCAETLVQLAWTVGRRGRTDEALELNRRAYDVLVQLLQEVKQDDAAKLDYVHSLLGNLFYQRAKVHQRRAELGEAQKALESALEWQRKAPDNHELAKLLRELAELKFFKQEWNEGARLLEEASVVYRERNMLPELVECLHLMGRACATIGNLKGAEQYLSMASHEAAQCGRNQKAAEVLLSLAYLAMEQRDVAAARERFEAAISASNDGEFQAKCLMQLSRLAPSEGHDNDRIKLVQQAIHTLKEELDKPKSEMDYANVHFTLGWYSREIGHLEGAHSHSAHGSNLFF